MSIEVSPVTGHYVDVEVVGILYQVFYLESGSGIPLLCQHTASGHNHEWRNLLRDSNVTDKYHVIAWDLPFHGKSDPPHGEEWWKEEYRLTDAFAQEFVIQFMRALGLEKPVFMGCSAGGLQALNLARDRADEFRAVIALEATDVTEDFYLDWWSHPAVDTGSVLASVLEGLLSPQTPERDRRLAMFYNSQCATGVMKGGVYSWSREEGTRGSFSTIDTSRTLLYLMAGEYDYLATPDLLAATAEKIPGSTPIVMSGLGHFPMTEDYSTFRQYIVPVLDEIAAR